MMRRVFSVLAALAMGLAVFLGAATPAQAHSDGFLSQPEEGATVSEVTQLQFTFVEAVEQSFPPEVVLTSGSGARFDLGDPSYDASGATMTVPILSGALPNGDYVAVYRIVSVDGHPASGELTFTVEGSSAVAPSATAEDAVVTSADEDAAAQDILTVSAEEATAQLQLVLALSAAGAVALALVIVFVALRRKRNSHSAQ